MRCKDCHYALERLGGHRCPECGRAFDPGDPRTFQVAQDSRGGLLFWLASPACWLVMQFFGSVLASGGKANGWNTALSAALASSLLIPLIALIGHRSREAAAFAGLLICSVLALDMWVVWKALGSSESFYFRKMLIHRPVPMIAWMLAYFGWQLLLLPFAFSVVRAMRRSAVAWNPS